MVKNLPGNTSNDTPVLSLDAFVRMKLTSYRDKHRIHLRDMIDVGLLDDLWPQRFTGELRERLQFLIDHPED